MVAYWDCRVVDLLSDSSAKSAPAGRKCGLTAPIREERGIQVHKKKTNEASMLLKTREGKRKRTQNELILSSQICSFDAKSEPSSAAGVRAAGSPSGIPRGPKSTHPASLGESQANTKTVGTKLRSI